MTIGLRISVYSTKGAQIGVPKLIKSLVKHDAGATFFFSMGPDYDFYSISQLFRSIGMGHLKLKSTFSRKLINPPWLNKECIDVIKTTKKQGYEIGVNAFNANAWLGKVRRATPNWTALQMKLARAEFCKIFDEPPFASAAPFWQMNKEAYRLNQRLGYKYSSDTRGSHAYIPIFQGEIIGCPQIPTTLHTISEIVLQKKQSSKTAINNLLQLTQKSLHHVYAANAESEGIKYHEAFDTLLGEWRKRKYQIVSLKEYLDNSVKDLPRHTITSVKIAGIARLVEKQGSEFLI
ncbi:MAG: hypothetical protein CMK56_01315 [Proteobacteria bacterium]|nr:hypothetical protein [Pseudomonadota bacterium]